MKKSWGALIGPIPVILLMGGLFFVMYQSYMQNGITPSFANTFATGVLVFITAWYAWLVRRQLFITNQQVKAAQATYTPDLVAETELDDEHFLLSLKNTGEGTAKNIYLYFDVIVPGYIYTYKLRFESSLPSNHAFEDSSLNPSCNKLEVIPRFKTEIYHDKDRYTIIRKILFNDFKSIRSASELKEFDQLIAGFYEEGIEYPEVRITVNYNDVLEEKHFEEILLEDAVVEPGQRKISSISKEQYVYKNISSSPQGRLEYVQLKAFEQFGGESRSRIMYTDQLSAKVVQL